MDGIRTRRCPLRVISGHCRMSEVYDVRYWPKADILTVPAHVRFSNRPVGVKRFQTIHHDSVDVAHGLVLLFGIGTRALPSWDSKTRGTIFGTALPLDKRQVQADIRSHLIHRSARDRGLTPPIRTHVRAFLGVCFAGLMIGKRGHRDDGEEAVAPATDRPGAKLVGSH